MKPRIRLLPVVIFCAAFTATLKLGSIVHGVGGLIAATSAAESGAPEKAAAAATPAQPKDGSGAKKVDEAGEAAEKFAASGAEVKKLGEWVDPAAMTGAELEVLQKLSARRKVLEKRATELDMRENLLQATERRVDAKVVELKRIQSTINSLLKRHDKEKEAQMKSVVKIYENMKPKNAARIFEQLDLTILLDVVERMREVKMAPIMANMSPVKAKSVTMALARRRALPNPDAGKRQ